MGIRQLSSGGFNARVMVNGVRHTQTFTTRQEAKDREIPTRTPGPEQVAPPPTWRAHGAVGCMQPVQILFVPLVVAEVWLVAAGRTEGPLRAMSTGPLCTRVHATSPWCSERLRATRLSSSTSTARGSQHRASSSSTSA